MIYTDELLYHMRSCESCIIARITSDIEYCDQGRSLIKLTLIERHGSDVDGRGTSNSPDQGTQEVCAVGGEGRELPGATGFPYRLRGYVKDVGERSKWPQDRDGDRN